MPVNEKRYIVHACFGVNAKDAEDAKDIIEDIADPRWAMEWNIEELVALHDDHKVDSIVFVSPEMDKLLEAGSQDTGKGQVMYDFYVIHSRSLELEATLYTENLERQGYTCFLPCRDLDDDRPPLNIYRLRDGIIRAISESRAAVMIWDGVSTMSLIDLGAVMMAGLPIKDVKLYYRGQVHALVEALRQEANEKGGLI